ncbi:hypothetical protein [Maribacter sp. R86514]|uniref:hypothetical protein n=1 Tax=Maribacter sp. R86514 TaxID=3093854 RepID=UPI0037CCA0AA
MLKYVITLLFSVSLLNAQNNVTNQTEVNVGDVFEIGKPESNKYKHIDFPRENFIIKRGGIANYRRAHGEEVVVTAVRELKDGTTQVKIKRNDGGRFFNSHTVVTADFKDAITSGELQAL